MSLGNMELKRGGWLLRNRTSESFEFIKVCLDILEKKQHVVLSQVI